MGRTSSTVEELPLDGPEARVLEAAVALMETEPSDTLSMVWRAVSGTTQGLALIMDAHACGPAPQQIFSPDLALQRELASMPVFAALTAIGTAPLHVLGRHLFLHTFEAGGPGELRLTVVTVEERLSTAASTLMTAVSTMVDARVRQHAREARPPALALEAQVAAERRRAVAYLEQRHRADLEEVLAALRAGPSNPVAQALASRALVDLRRRSNDVADAGAVTVGSALGAVREELGRLLGRARVQVEWVDDPPEALLPPATAHAAKHLTRAALQNVVDHSGAGRALVRWTATTTVLAVSLADDGRGFEAGHPEGPGLRGVRERLAALGCDLAIDANPGWGTRLTASLPLLSGPAAPSASDHAASAAVASLGDRELEVLRLLVTGRRNDQIAGVLNLSPHTVKTYVSRVLRKLEVTSRTEAAAVAQRGGFAGGLGG